MEGVRTPGHPGAEEACQSSASQTALGTVCSLADCASDDQRMNAAFGQIVVGGHTGIGHEDKTFRQKVFDRLIERMHQGLDPGKRRTRATVPARRRGRALPWRHVILARDLVEPERHLWENKQCPPAPQRVRCGMSTVVPRGESLPGHPKLVEHRTAQHWGTCHEGSTLCVRPQHAETTPICSILSAFLASRRRFFLFNGTSRDVLANPFVERSQITVRLVFDPPSHRRDHAAERCWGIEEQFWNDSLFDSADAVIQNASTVTGKETTRSLHGERVSLNPASNGPGRPWTQWKSTFSACPPWGRGVWTDITSRAPDLQESASVLKPFVQTSS